MVKNHLKRLSAPRSWHVKRKGITFMTRPLPGGHTKDHSMSLTSVMRTLLKVAKTSKEVKYILNNKTVLVDGKRRKEPKFPVGLMDVITFPDLKESYRMTMDNKGRLVCMKTSDKEAGFKLSRIRSKTKLSKGKTQLNMLDGRAIIVDKDTYKTGDVLALELPSQKIKEHLKLDKKQSVLLIGGKHAGESGKIEEIKENKLIYKNKDNEMIETLKKYAFVIGGAEPLIKIQ